MQRGGLNERSGSITKTSIDFTTYNNDFNIYGKQLWQLMSNGVLDIF